MIIRNVFLLATLAFVIGTLSSCAEPTARIMDDDEEDMVDARGAGAATFEQLITKTVAELLDRHKKEYSEVKVRRLAFVDLRNRTSEELGEWREQLIDKILIGVDKHIAFRIISAEMVNAVLGEMDNPPIEKLFIPSKARQFAKVLERKESPVQYLMYGSITRGETRGAGARQANYLLTLRLMNIETGATDTVGTQVRKSFTQ